MPSPRLITAAVGIALTLAVNAAADSYDDDVSAIAKQRDALAKERVVSGESKELMESAETAIVSAIGQLSQAWLGTRWGLGPPQSSVPKLGKINCGTFVGTVLRDAGFNVDVAKLQRQPSQLIIKSFVGGKRIRKFSRAPMKKFIASVREMGPGLFIIGLDFHVGFLLQTEDELRFVHASYVTETVVNEAAATAAPITSSKYRVVGKLLTGKNLRDWMRGTRIKVKGNW